MPPTRYLRHARKSELLACGHRLFDAITLIQQATTTHFLQLATRQIAERNARLSAFNRMVSHEIRNQLGAVLGAGDLLAEIPDLDPEKRAQLGLMIARHARSMRDTLEDLVAVTRLEATVQQHRHVRLLEAAEEAHRQVREAAEKAGAVIRISPDLPNEEVDAAVVELALTNYLTNAIKYAKRDSEPPLAEISGDIVESPHNELVVRVTEKGPGVSRSLREKLFDPFFRAEQAGARAEGTGLGLSNVRDAVELAGGRAWAEFPESGAVFAFSLPLQRSASDGRDPDDTQPG